MFTMIRLNSYVLVTIAWIVLLTQTAAAADIVSDGVQNETLRNTTCNGTDIECIDWPPYMRTTTGLVVTCCLGVSIICMSIRLLMQGCVPEYRKSFGWQQFSLVGAMFVGQGAYLAGKFLHDYEWPCFAMSIASQWGFLVSFMWLSVIAIDTWRAFSYDTFFGHAREITAFGMYAFYATAIPTLITGVPIVFYFDAGDSKWSSQFEDFTPNYKSCGVDLAKPYFVITLIASVLVAVMVGNFVIYLYVVVKLNTDLKANITASKKGRKRGIAAFSSILVLKLAAWSFATTYGFFQRDFIEIIFVGFLTVQGLFVFVALVCTLKCKCACKPAKFGEQTSDAAGSRANLIASPRHSYASQNSIAQKGSFQMVSISSMTSLSRSHSKFQKPDEIKTIY